jgi:hypothetical protein
MYSMKNIPFILLSGAGLLLTRPSYGQYAADAFRFSEITQTGTARFQGVGGNHAALGGDASTISGNPAGLGFYNRSELSLTPSFRNLTTTSSYLGSSSTDGKTNPNLAQASLVIAGSPQSFNSKWKRTTIGISYTRQQTFQNLFTYSGRNNRSAYIDAAVEAANRRNISSEQLDKDYDSNTLQAYSLEGAYYQLYMLNPSTAVGPPYVRYDRESPTDQLGSFESTGAHTQWNFAYAGNYDDRVYIGASIGFNRIRYNYSSSLDDRYLNGRVFKSSNHTEDLNVSGNGINATLGIIYKASPELQLGASFTSPSFMAIKETYNEIVSADVIGIPMNDPNGNPSVFVPDVTQIGLLPYDFEYAITSPLRASGGATYFVGQSGFITGTVEYVGYGGMRVSTNTLNASENTTFRNDNRREIQDTYASGVNVRLGGEYRAGMFRARAGAAYLGDAYRVKLDGINRSKMVFSGGVGFRSERFFADATAVYNSYQSAYTPYVLNNQRDFASVDITNRSINVLITLGTFF